MAHSGRAGAKRSTTRTFGADGARTRPAVRHATGKTTNSSAGERFARAAISSSVYHPTPVRGPSRGVPSKATRTPSAELAQPIPDARRRVVPGIAGRDLGRRRQALLTGPLLVVGHLPHEGAQVIGVGIRPLEALV